MIGKIVQGMNSAKLTILERLSESKLGIIDEMNFMDDFSIKYHVDCIRLEIKEIDDEIFKSEVKQQKLELINKRNELIKKYVFILSNSIKNIDFCIEMCNKNENLFIALNAIKQYELNNKDKALKLFNEYYDKNKYLLNHYLINKIYGELLFENKQYEKAAIFLRKASEKRPEEIVLHILLNKIYKNTNEVILEENETEIIELLGGVNIENN